MVEEEEVVAGEEEEEVAAEEDGEEVDGTKEDTVDTEGREGATSINCSRVSFYLLQFCFKSHGLKSFSVSADKTVLFEINVEYS